MLFIQCVLLDFTIERALRDLELLGSLASASLVAMQGVGDHAALVLLEG